MDTDKEPWINWEECFAYDDQESFMDIVFELRLEMVHRKLSIIKNLREKELWYKLEEYKETHVGCFSNYTPGYWKCLSLYPQHVEQCLLKNWGSVNICWMNE